MRPWEEENSDFLAKWLNNELSEQERKEFEDSEEGKVFMKLVQASDNLELSHFDVDESFDQFKPRYMAKRESETKTFSISPFTRMAIAAGLVAIAIVAYLLVKPNYTVVSTGYGQNETIVLPGGSFVTLNSNTTVKYAERKWDSKRKVILEGEAFFDVVKGNDFIVNTSEGDIKVLGTSFNIRARDDDLDVICYTGRVNVSNSNMSTDLVPGNAVRVKDGELIKEWSKQLSAVPPWTNGFTEMDNVTFDVVLSELRNLFDISINYDGSMDEIPFRGTFSNANTEEAVKLVMLAMDIRYTFDSTTNTLTIEGLN